MRRWLGLAIGIALAVGLAGCQESTPIPISDSAAPSGMAIPSQTHQVKSV